MNGEYFEATPLGCPHCKTREFHLGINQGKMLLVVRCPKCGLALICKLATRDVEYVNIANQGIK